MNENEMHDADYAGGRLLLGWILVAVAAALIVGGWFGVSGEPEVARQMAYLVSGGIGGIVSGVIGVGLLISHDVRRDRERLGRLEAAVLELRELVVAQAAQAEQADRIAAEPADTSVRKLERKRRAR